MNEPNRETWQKHKQLFTEPFISRINNFHSTPLVANESTEITVKMIKFQHQYNFE